MESPGEDRLDGMRQDTLDPAVFVTPEEDGRSTRVELFVEGRSVSRCWIVSQQIRLGRAVVRMDGIGGVGTEPAFRNRGYARRVLSAAIRAMEAGDAGLSMLYGIPNFYENFGYAQAGPEYLIEVEPSSGSGTPKRWTARPATMADFEEIRRLYDLAIEDAIGAAVRKPNCYAWRRLQEQLQHGDVQECVLAISPSGEARGYARRAEGYWAADVLGRDNPGWRVVGEVISLDGEAARVLIDKGLARVAPLDPARHRGWLIAAPHDSAVATAAEWMGHRLRRDEKASGGSMARLLDAYRLLRDAAPELARRLSVSGCRLRRPLIVATPSAQVELSQEEAGLSVRPCANAAGGIARDVWTVSGQELVRAVLGEAVPDDVCRLQRTGLTQEAAEALRAMFPRRCSHMYLPDRY